MLLNYPPTFEPWHVCGGSAIWESVGAVGLGCLPGPSFICPHHCLHSGLHHPFSSSSSALVMGVQTVDTVDLFAWNSRQAREWWRC